MRGFDRNRLLAISATGVLAAGALGGASLVAAQSGGDGADENNANEEGQRPHKRAKGGALATIFDVSGLDASVFRDGFAEGLTVNEILAQNGLDSAVIQASALAALSGKLDEKVAAGDIDEDRAAAIVAKAEEMLPQLMDSTPPERGQHHHRGAQRLGAVLETAADAIDVETSDLVQAIRDGETVGSYASSQGVDAQTVIDALVAQGTARIDEAVSNGLDPDRAVEMQSQLADRAAQFVNEGPPEGSGDRIRAHMKHHRVGRGLDAVADAIGITVDDLKGDLGEGSTIAGVASANGVDPQLVIDTLVSAAHDRIDQAVADGKKTPEEAAELKVTVAERIATLVNEGRPAEAPQPGAV